MRKIEKTKKIKKTPKAKVVKLKKATNTPAYYLCMGTNYQGKNIAQVAHDCKSNTPTLVAQRTKKIKELAKAAKVIGKFAQDLEKVLA